MDKTLKKENNENKRNEDPKRGWIKEGVRSLSWQIQKFTLGEDFKWRVYLGMDVYSSVKAWEW